MNLEHRIKQAMVDVVDFPKPGIVFKDITPLFQDPGLSLDLVQSMSEQARAVSAEAVLGLESRGFLYGMPIALQCGLPFIMARKKGKLPRSVHSVTYDLEYGQSTLEVHVDAIQPGQRVVIHDDVLATGGTAAAAAELVRMAGGLVVGFQFIVELTFLEGRSKLNSYGVDVITFANY
ncbi:MAG: adenine phosphoribosyltransferase [Flavobacteriales bacterium]